MVQRLPVYPPLSLSVNINIIMVELLQLIKQY